MSVDGINEISRKQKEGFEGLSFLSEVDKTIFQEFAKLNANMEVTFVSREEFEKKNGFFLVENGKGGGDKPVGYDLFIPYDLKDAELPAIIKRISEITYKENNSPKEAFTVFGIILKTAIINLLIEKKKTIDTNGNIIDKYRNIEINRILRKYVSLYEQYFSDETLSEIFDPDFEKRITQKISDLQKQKSDEITRAGKEKSQIIKNIADLSSGENQKSTDDLERDLDTVLSQAMRSALDIALFQKGKKDIVNYQTVFTQADYQKLVSTNRIDILIGRIKLFNSGQIRITKDDGTVEIKDVIFKKLGDDTIAIHDIEGNLLFTTNGEIEQEKQLITLKDYLQFDLLKEKLEKAKRSGNIEEISKMEFDIAAEILKAILRLPRNSVNTMVNGSTASTIIDSKMPICVGKSNIAHSLFDEIGITNYGNDVPAHSTITIKLSNGKEYLFEATNFADLKDLSKYTQISTGLYTLYEGIYQKENYDKGIIYSGDGEEVLASSIYLNLGMNYNTQKDNENAFQALLNGIRFNENTSDTNSNIGKILIESGLNKEGLKYLRKGLKLNPENSLAINNIGIILLRKGEYTEAIEYFTKAIEKNRNNDEKSLFLGNRAISYYHIGELDKALDDLNQKHDIQGLTEAEFILRGVLYLGLGRYSEALEKINEVISLYPNNKEAVVWKIGVYFEMGNMDEVEKLINSGNIKYNEIIKDLIPILCDQYILIKKYELIPHLVKFFLQNNLKDVDFQSFPKEGKVYVSDIYYYMGKAQFLMGEFDNAITSLNDSIRFNPTYSDIQKLIIASKLKLGQTVNYDELFKDSGFDEAKKKEVIQSAIDLTK